MSQHTPTPSTAMAIDFPLSPLRRYLWDHLSEILHPDEHQQRRRPTPSGLSSTWAAGTGHEGFDGFRIELKKFSSGQSNPTFLLVVHLLPPSGASPSGKATSTTTCRFVLRKKPASVKVSSAHAVEREFRILRALRLDTSSNVPVPRALLLCEDTAVIGTAFYVMQFVQGRIFSDAALPGLRPSERAAIYESAAETLARLHRVDFVRAGLEGFGRAKGGYLGRQVATLERVATKQAEDAGPIAGFAEVVRDLRELTASGSNVVADRVTIVHGDFRIDNLVFHPAEPRVIAVLDWELSTLGHPLADLANLCILHHLPASASALAPVPAPPRGPRAAGGSGVHAASQTEGAEASASSPSPSPSPPASSPLAGLKGLDLDALGIPQQSELMNAYRRAAAAAAASGGGFDEHQPPLAGVAGPGVAELGLAFVFFKMAVIAHGVKARQSRGVASSAQASLVSAMVPEMVALATEQISKLKAVKAGETLDNSGGEGDGGGGDKQGAASRRCNPSMPMPLPLPPPKAVLFDVGGVLSGSPLLAIAEFERDTRPSLPPSYVGVAIAAAGEGGLFQRLERGEERLGDRFLERFAEYLCSDGAKRAYVDWFVARWAAGKGGKGGKGRGKRRPLSSPVSSTAASQQGGFKTSSPPRAANDVINRSECQGESSSSSSSSARGEATAAVASVVAVDALELFRRITEAARIPVPEMFAAAEALRRQGFKVGVVSNDFLVERGFVMRRRRRLRGTPEDETCKLAAAAAAGSGMRLSERAEEKDRLEAAADAAGGPEVGKNGSSSSSGSSGVGGDVYSRLPALCDVVVLSSRSRCRKPGDAIYRRACDELGVSASEVVFVDDIRVNIQAAGALGMRTVWVEPGGSVDAAVSELEAVTGVRLAALAEAGAGVRRPAGKL